MSECLFRAWVKQQLKVSFRPWEKKIRGSASDNPNARHATELSRDFVFVINIILINRWTCTHSLSLALLALKPDEVIVGAAPRNLFFLLSLEWLILSCQLSTFFMSSG